MFFTWLGYSHAEILFIAVSVVVAYYITASVFIEWDVIAIKFRLCTLNIICSQQSLLILLKMLIILWIYLELLLIRQRPVPSRQELVCVLKHKKARFTCAFD